MVNGNIITPVAQSTLKLSPALSKVVQHAFILDDLATVFLILIGQLCEKIVLYYF